ncbi:MAG: histidine phosphatase family protein [Ruminococcus sp.]|nr:histidine phosphatase family protein [Ruminococcus sp.]MCM1381358.1 histidine phosphatase family protein [Muribaculaceae bacterium]MCM1480366.1 histidine phosphatase family protein [Muribaculaceae bacterium]
MKIIFIRHGKTAGNLEKRYIGRTDETLCTKGIDELLSRNYPDCEIVFSSGMKRCTDTAKIIYPNKKIIKINDFRECDFGDFEGKNYYDLSGNSDYQKWIDSGGKMTFPNGENPDKFKKRCISAFEKITEKYEKYGVISLVVHGGTIMSILEKYAVPKKDYYDYQIKNGDGFITEFDGEKIIILEKI